MKNHFINFKGRLISTKKPLIMGILNVTPDSFYDGGKHIDEKNWLSQCEKMILEGADIIDVGCVSTRPGSQIIDEKEELKRILPVMISLQKNFPDIIISVDTFRSKIAEETISAGASMINDISGGTMDEKMFETIKKLKVPFVLMHIQGSPENMQNNPSYKNVTKEIIYWLSQRVAELKLLGINDIIIDPGFGFGKTIEHNFQLLRDLDFFNFFPFPLLIGISRKSMIWKTLKASPALALNGTSILHAISLLKGADILRVHDVKEAKECIELVSNFI